MSEIASVSAGQRARLVLDAQRRVDQQRADVVQGRLDAFSEAQRRTQIIEQQVTLQEQRIRDRRNDQELETAQARQVDEEQSILDTIDNDSLFQRDQDQILGELNDARDSREGTEALLVRDLQGARNDVLELDAQAQRADDIRNALNDRQARITERRAAERDEEIRQQIDLRVSLDRIDDSGTRPLRPQDTPTGGIVDVSA